MRVSELFHDRGPATLYEYGETTVVAEGECSISGTREHFVSTIGDVEPGAITHYEGTFQVSSQRAAIEEGPGHVYDLLPTRPPLKQPLPVLLQYDESGSGTYLFRQAIRGEDY